VHDCLGSVTTRARKGGLRSCKRRPQIEDRRCRGAIMLSPATGAAKFAKAISTLSADQVLVSHSYVKPIQKMSPHFWCFVLWGIPQGFCLAYLPHHFPADVLTSCTRWPVRFKITPRRVSKSSAFAAARSRPWPRSRSCFGRRLSIQTSTRSSSSSPIRAARRQSMPRACSTSCATTTSFSATTAT